MPIRKLSPHQLTVLSVLGRTLSVKLLDLTRQVYATRIWLRAWPASWLCRTMGKTMTSLLRRGYVRRVPDTRSFWQLTASGRTIVENQGRLL